MPPKLSLCLDEKILATGPMSYALNEAGSDLRLRAFMFQNGSIYNKDGRELGGAVTASDIDWGSKQLLGKGASGSVFLAKHKDGTTLAVKTIPIDSKTHRDEVERELTFLLSKYDTAYVVKNYGAFWNPDEDGICIPMEWMPYSLTDISKFHKGLPEEIVRDIFFQVVRALEYLHNKKKLIHRDIKPSNVLLSSEGEAKIGDFGVSKMVQTLNVNSTYVGTMLYMAPERLEEGVYDFSSDVWSLGIMFIAIATGSNPWSVKNEEEPNLFQLIKKISGEEIPKLPDGFSETARDFVRQCLKRDPMERPSCTDLLRHKFFADCTLESARQQIKRLLILTSRLVNQSAKK